MEPFISLWRIKSHQWVATFKLMGAWVINQDKNLKHTIKSEISFLQWRSQSLDLNWDPMHVAKQVVNTWIPFAVRHLKSANSGPRVPDLNVEQTLIVAVNAWWHLLLPALAQPVVRLRGQILLAGRDTLVQASWDKFFSFDKCDHYLKSACFSIVWLW